MADRRTVRASMKRIVGLIPEKDRKAYDPDRFYLRASDQRGHSTQMRYDLPPADRAMMSELIAMDIFPYRSYADVIRDAVHHRCHYLLDPENVRGLVPEILDNLARREMEEIVETRVRNLKFYAQMKAKIRSVVAQLESADYPAWETSEMLNECRVYAEQLREPYRGKLLGFLVETGAQIGLSLVEPSDADDADDIDADNADGIE